MIGAAIATPRVARAFIASLYAILGIKTAIRAGLFAVPNVDPQALTDFDAFHVVGRMVWRGDVADAYHLPSMIRVQAEMTGRQEFLPWTYPPQFDLVTAALACLPSPLAYLLFVGLTLAAYLVLLHRIAGEAFPVVLAALFPTLALTVACGQNGFLTGALIGLACLALGRGRATAGLPLGLMAIKPHLAAALGLYVLVTRRWGCALLAVSVAILSGAIATLLLGSSIWTAFLAGVAEAGTYLAAGAYPMFRMVSVYAVLRSFDLPAAVALGVQAVVALGVLGAVVWSALRLQPRQALGISAFAGLLISPYAYDYDLPLYGIALALLAPGLLRLSTGREQAGFLALSWITCGYGMAVSALTNAQAGPGLAGPDGPVAGNADPVSLAGLGLLALFILVCRALLRADRASTAAAGGLQPIAA